MTSRAEQPMTVEWIRARRTDHARQVADLTLGEISMRAVPVVEEVVRRLGLTTAPAESQQRRAAGGEASAP